MPPRVIRLLPPLCLLQALPLGEALAHRDVRPFLGVGEGRHKRDAGA
eukprot:CAMPEP_0117583306 /NCGR_PEP_ID=MMETSP0784-20121206/66938_1 /TAXON_ID=39447 /ORGANISM="" /LENGTH=46 /DNA_ID= /DNA_START= /DNA_END= /DNA_ORIENTATION=